MDGAATSRDSVAAEARPRAYTRRSSVHVVRDSIADGTFKVDDDAEHSFFAKGRDFEAVGDAHAYTKQELDALNSFDSIEYLPPNNKVYREYLERGEHRTRGARWVCMGLVGAVVGTVGYLLKSVIKVIFDWRKHVLFPECDYHDAHKTPAEYNCGFFEPGSDFRDAGLLFLAFTGIAVAFAMAAAAIVVFVQPAAAASGIPEVIAYLNGTHQHRIFNVKTLAVKFVSCALAVGSGLPVGPEGPMIHMGAIIGRGVSNMHSTTVGFSLPFFKQFRNVKDSRDFLTAGAAAGVASAFGAPVGGLLFALEEVASTWSQTLTWQVTKATVEEN